MKRILRKVLAFVLVLGMLCGLAAGASAASISGVKVNALPYSSNGVTITEITIDKYDRVGAIVKNDTGYAISGISGIEYTCYNGSGVVLKSGTLYLKDMNAGESCLAVTYMESGTAEIVFGAATVKQGTASYAGATDTISGIAVNSLPYSSNGLQITGISIHEKKVDLAVKNNTGSSISGLSSFVYKCYDGSGVVIKSSSVYMEDLNSGESCVVHFYMEDDTQKILFGEATVREGKESFSGEMQTIGGIDVNALPYSSNGLEISSISISDNKVSVTVTNNTGIAISDLSKFDYKCYTGSSTVLKSGNLYLEELNDGESCVATFYMEEGTRKIIFGVGSVKEGDGSSSAVTTIIQGITVNELPYSSEGLEITDISFDGRKASVTVKNNTGSAAGDLSKIEYKCYDGSGTVLESGNLYLEDMNSGESCLVTTYLEKGTQKIIFGKATVREGTATPPEGVTAVIGRYTVNALPYSSNGLQITDISFDGSKASVTVKNNAGYDVSDSSRITYKLYDARGTVLRSGSLFMENMKIGESCLETLYLEEGTQKIIFFTATVK